MLSFNGPELLAATAETLMTGAIRRAKSIRSGRLAYRFDSGAVGSNGISSRRLSSKVLTFSDSDWIERDVDRAATSIHRRAYTLHYNETRQPDGSVHRTAVISQPTSLQGQENENRPPWFAGSFWRAGQLEYVEQHRARFRLVMPSKVAGIPCEICELDVPASEMRRVVNIVHPRLAAGGTLRVHVAPQLGFALPLVEVLAPDDTEVVTYESKGFVEMPDKTHFPRQIRMEIQFPTGVTRYEQFTITADRINQPIPDSEFVMLIPAGTQVRDERDATQFRRFELMAPSTSSELAGEPQSSLTAEADHFVRNRVLAIAGAIVVAIFCCMIAVRYLRNRS